MKDIAELHREYLNNPTESFFYGKHIDYVLLNTLLQLILDKQDLDADTGNILDMKTGMGRVKPIVCLHLNCKNQPTIALLGEKVDKFSDGLENVPICLECANEGNISLGEGKRKILGLMLRYHISDISDAMKEYQAQISKDFGVSVPKF